MNIVFFIGGVVFVVVVFMAGVKTGRAYEQNTTIAANLVAAERVIVKQEEVIREVPRIVTRTVTREVEVVKEVERVVAQIPDLLAPDCVLPERYGMLLASAANGVDPNAGGADAFAGEYGCREVLAATLADLQAGWRNTARLGGLQEAIRLVMEPPK